MGDEMGGFFHVGVKDGGFGQFRRQDFLLYVNGFQHQKQDAADKQPLGHTETDAQHPVDEAGNHQFDGLSHEHAGEVDANEDCEERDDKRDVTGGEHPVQFFFYKIGELVGDKYAQNEGGQRENLLDEAVFETFEDGPEEGNQQ